MAPHTILYIAAGYFALLFLVSRLSEGKRDNDAFFRGARQSPWWAVAFGMIGASVSGVTFVSVPGMVEKMHMTYLQTCMGFFFGYVFVAFVLLPVYDKLNLISIYTYLQKRLGDISYRTGASFFFISKLIGASIRLYLVCSILQTLIFNHYGIPFHLTSVLVLALIWLYTRKSGIKTIVWSDCLQTFVLLSALVLIIFQVCAKLDFSVADAVDCIRSSEMGGVFVFDDMESKQYFWKQFVSGIFIVVVMTGLDQDMMQKNLTCKTLRQSQLNMCVNGALYLPVNMLFLGLGVLLYTFCNAKCIELPSSGDDLLPMLCGSGAMGDTTLVLFVLGIVAAAFSSADSAMASLTTCLCVDILQKPQDERLRKLVHPLVAVCVMVFISIVRALNDTSVIDAVYVVCGYTYGPLLGMYAFGFLTRRRTCERLVPWFCVLSPLACYALDLLVLRLWGVKLGYELLMINGSLTFLCLLLTSSEFGTDNAGGDCHV